MNILKNDFILVSLIFTLFSCGDNVSLQKNDLRKYPWLTPFTNNLTDTEFEGFHNIDLGIIKFNYDISSKNCKSIFMRFDSIAEFEGWKTLKKSKLIREYTRSISQNAKYSNQIVMKIEMDTTEQKLLFEIE